MDTLSQDNNQTRILAEMMRAIGMSRRPGVLFSAHFLALRIEMSESGARLTLDQGPHLTDDNGEIDLTCFGILVDMAIGRGIRSKTSHLGRAATTNINLGLTGAPRIGPLIATARFLTFVNRSVGAQAIAHVEVVGPGGLIAYASGTYAIVDGQALPAIELNPPTPPALTRAELNEHEYWLLARAETALNRATSEGGTFITRFWDFTGVTHDGGATIVVANGPHIANRARHFHGGIQIGLAAATAQTALGSNWMTTGINTNYLRPGLSDKFRSVSEIVHRGRTTAVVTTRIFDDQQRAILQATSTHAARLA